MGSRPEDIHPNPAPHDRRSPWWAIVIAVSITVGINAVIPYTHHYMHTISLVEGMIPMGILMPFFALIFILTPYCALMNELVQMCPRARAFKDIPLPQGPRAEHVSQIQDYPAENRHGECHAHGDQTQ